VKVFDGVKVTEGVGLCEGVAVGGVVEPS
jgi:hypothetical protein